MVYILIFVPFHIGLKEVLNVHRKCLDNIDDHYLHQWQYETPLHTVERRDGVVLG